VTPPARVFQTALKAATQVPQDFYMEGVLAARRGIQEGKNESSLAELMQVQGCVKKTPKNNDLMGGSGVAA